MNLCFRQKLRTYNIEIQVEGGSRDDRSVNYKVKTLATIIILMFNRNQTTRPNIKTEVAPDNVRKNGISNKVVLVSANTLIYRLSQNKPRDSVVKYRLNLSVIFGTTCNINIYTKIFVCNLQAD